MRKITIAKIIKSNVVNTELKTEQDQMKYWPGSMCVQIGKYVRSLERLLRGGAKASFRL